LDKETESLFYSEVKCKGLPIQFSLEQNKNP